MRQLILAVLLASALAACGGGKTITNTIDDASITAQVKTVLLNDPEVNATKIDVSTSNGVVTMSGLVRSKPEEQRAVQLARSVNGVRDVKSAMQVGS